MCNPRRVSVTATREVAEAWQVELERRVALSDTVVSELEISFPFGGTLGDRTRAVFESALGRDPHWTRTADGAHELRLTDGQVIYRPADGELVVRARLTDTARAEGVASTTLSGTVTDVAHGEGEGRYYYGDSHGRQAADVQARRNAESAAERNARALLDNVRRRAERASARAERDAEDDVRQAAAEDAAVRLEAERARVREELDALNRVRAEQLGQDALRAVNAVLALAYREALLAFAEENGATGVRVEESADSIAIEFEMET